MNYVKLLEISSFLLSIFFLEVGKTQDMPNKIWQTLGDALMSSPSRIGSYKFDITLTCGAILQSF